MSTNRTTESALRKFLEQHEGTMYTFNVELYEQVGFEAYMKLVEKFGGETVKFPKKSEIQDFLIDPANSTVNLAMRRVVITESIV